MKCQCLRVYKANTVGTQFHNTRGKAAGTSTPESEGLHVGF